MSCYQGRIERPVVFSEIPHPIGGEDEDVDLAAGMRCDSSFELRRPDLGIGACGIDENPEVEVALCGVGAAGPGSVDPDPSRPLRQSDRVFEEIEVEEAFDGRPQGRIAPDKCSFLPPEQSLADERIEVAGGKPLGDAGGDGDRSDRGRLPEADVAEDADALLRPEDLGEHDLEETVCDGGRCCFRSVNNVFMFHEHDLPYGRRSAGSSTSVSWAVSPHTLLERANFAGPYLFKGFFVGSLERCSGSYAVVLEAIQRLAAGLPRMYHPGGPWSPVEVESPSPQCLWSCTRDK